MGNGAQGFVDSKFTLVKKNSFERFVLMTQLHYIFVNPVSINGSLITGLILQDKYTNETMK